MHRSGIAGIIIDCKTDDLNREAQFWSQALGYGIAESQGSEKYINLDVPKGRPYIELQKVDHESRVHIDLRSDDMEAEVKRLEAIGAVIIERKEHWTILEAPSGHRFCVIQITQGKDLGPLNEWP